MIGVRSPKGFMFNIRSALSTEVAIKFLQFLRGVFFTILCTVIFPPLHRLHLVCLRKY